MVVLDKITSHSITVGETVYTPGDELTLGRFATAIFAKPPVNVSNPKHLVRALVGSKPMWGVKVEYGGSDEIQTEFTVITEGDSDAPEEEPIRKLTQGAEEPIPGAVSVVASRLDDWANGRASIIQLLQTDAEFPQPVIHYD